MARASRGLKLIGLLVFVLGVMSFGSTAAQAEPGAYWRIEGSAVTDKLNAELKVDLAGASGKLLTKTGFTKVEIECSWLKAVDMLLKTSGGLKGKVHFEGCKTKLNEKATGACVPHSPGASNGLIETNALDGLIKLHNLVIGEHEVQKVKIKLTTLVDQVELLPASSTPFVTLVFGDEIGSECAIKKFDITGPFFLKDSQNEGLVEKITHEVQEGSLSTLKFGSNAATIDGSAEAEFPIFSEEDHWFMTWSAVAN